MSKISTVQPSHSVLISKNTTGNNNYDNTHTLQNKSEPKINDTHTTLNTLMAFGELDEEVSSTAFACTEASNDGAIHHNWEEWPNKCHEQPLYLSNGISTIMAGESLATQQFPSDRLTTEAFAAHTNGVHPYTWAPASYFLVGGEQIVQQADDDDEHATMIPIASMHTGIPLELSAYNAFTHYCPPSFLSGVTFPSAPNTPESMDYSESTISPRTLQRYTDQQMNEGYQSGSDSYSFTGGYDTAESRGSTPGNGLYEYRQYHEPTLTSEIKDENEEEYNHLLSRNATDSIEPSLQDHYTTQQQQQYMVDDLNASSTYYPPDLHYDSHAQSKREEENALLKQCRESNMSYKQIRARFGNKYTESTLRGRWRTISKPRGQRVRKPKWYGNDVRLLDEAVKATTNPHDLSTVKWKEMAEQIVQRGGSYKFGVTTCKKKYLDVLKRGLEEVVKECGADYPPSNLVNSVHC